MDGESESSPQNPAETDVRNGSWPILLKISVGVFFGSAAFLFSGLNHACGLGNKAFEHWGALGLLGIITLIIAFVPRLRFGILVAIGVYAAWLFLVVRPYIDWVHGPENPEAVAKERRLEQLIEELRNAKELPTPKDSDSPNRD